MSQAEELLNGMSEEVPVHTHPVPDTDAYFVIDPITKQIENTSRRSTVIMQYTHNSERLTFELPRYIDGHDMLECTSVTVNANNIEVVKSDSGEEVEPIEFRVNPDAPDITDLRIHPNDPEKAICSWLISRNSTQLAGILSFHIEFKCVDSNGNVVYEWSTDNYDEIEVRARKKNGEVAVVEHTDLLEQWRTRIFGAGDSVMANIAAEGEAQVTAVKTESETQQEAVELKGAQTLDTIPEDYTEVDIMATKAVRTKADAIVCEAAGKSIVIRDSSDDHIRGLKVFGKTTQVTTTGAQLMPQPYYDSSMVRHGVTFTVNDDGSITMVGTNTAGDSVSCYFMLHSGFSATGVHTYKCYGLPETCVTNIYYRGDAVGDSEILLDLYEPNEYGFVIRVKAGATVNATVYPMLNVGETALPYEPYTGGKPSPSPEYPQELVSVGKGGSINIGINTNNLFDKDTNIFADATTIDKATGDIVTTSGNGWRTFENLLMVQPNTDYVISGSVVPSAWTCTVAFYDTNKNYLTFVNIQNNGGRNLLKFTTPDKAVYIRFTAHANSLDADTVVVNAGTSAIDYRVGHTQLLTILTPNGLPGIPVTSSGNYTDSDGQQWPCDEVDLERGVHIQRVANLLVNETSDVRMNIAEDGKTNGYAYRYFLNLNDIMINSESIMCNRLVHKSVNALVGNSPENVGIAVSPVYSCIYLNMNQHMAEDTIDACKAALANYPLIVSYILATPIETPLTAEEIAAFKALRTNYSNTTILNDAGAWMSVKYNADTKSYVENPKTLRLTDTSTGVVYELKIIDGNRTVVSVQ